MDPILPLSRAALSLFFIAIPVLSQGSSASVCLRDPVRTQRDCSAAPSLVSLSPSRAVYSPGCHLSCSHEAEFPGLPVQTSSSPWWWRALCHLPLTRAWVTRRSCPGPHNALRAGWSWRPQCPCGNAGDVAEATGLVSLPWVSGWRRQHQPAC